MMNASSTINATRAVRRLSSRWTFVAKYVMPALWITLFGSSTLALISAPGGAPSEGAQGAPPPEAPWIFLAAWLVGSAFLLWFAVPLKRVRLVDGALRVSNYWREVSVPLPLVADVRQNRWVNSRPITVRLKADVPGVGSNFVFMPPTRFNFAFWREDPVVIELRQLAGLRAVPGRTAA